MKRLNKTNGGRAFLIILCMLCVLAVGLCSWGELYMLTRMSVKKIYNSDEETVYEEMIKEEMYLEGLNILAQVKDYDTDEPYTLDLHKSNLLLEIRDSSERTILKSKDQPDMNQERPWLFAFDYEVEVVDHQVSEVRNVSNPEMYNYEGTGSFHSYQRVSTGEVIAASEVAEEEFEPEELTTETENADSSKKKTANTKNASASDSKKSYTDTATVVLSLKANLPEQDFYRETKENIHWIYKMRYVFPGVAGGAFLLGLIAYVLVLLGAGKRADSDEPEPLVAERLPWDVMFAGWMILAVSCLGLMVEGMTAVQDPLLSIVGLLMLVLFAVPIFFGISMSFVARIRQRKLIRSLLIYKVLRWILSILKAILRFAKGLLGILMEGFRNLPLIWRSMLAVAVLTLVEFFVIMLNLYEGDNILLCWLFEKMLLIPFIILIVLNLRKLEAGAKALAEGNLSYHTEGADLLPGIKQSAGYLNQIGVGMSKAVEERLKSERMKTELITNVSHDIKTPLTSVMNYAELINREVSKEEVVSSEGQPCFDTEQVKEYSEVLIRQSERLKKLLEDLVEASKAATGNLDVELIPCNAEIFLSQIAGEFGEKLENAGLYLVQKLPGKELIIQADGRRMWRLFSNLMNNICKYSLPGSRVYLTLEEVNGQAVFSFKNTSRDELNLSEEELMERFTRGDASRHTEGSGLGLAIAKSMADLQGGSMRIVTDGDLFKVETAFPIVR